MTTTTTTVGGKEGGGSSSQIPPRKKMFSGRLGRGTASTLEEKEKEGGGKTGSEMGIGENESMSLPTSPISSSSSSGVVTHVVYSKGLSKDTSAIFHHNNQNQNNHHHNNSNSNPDHDHHHHDEGRTSTSNNTVDAIATGCSRGMIKIWGMQYRPYSPTNATTNANGTETMLSSDRLDKTSLPPSPSSASSSPSSSSPLPPLRSVELVVALEVHEGKALTALALTDVVVYPTSSPPSPVPIAHPIHPQQSNDHHSHSHNSDSNNDTPSTSSGVSSRSSSKHRGLEGCRWLVMSGTLLRIKKDTLVHLITYTLVH